MQDIETATLGLFSAKGSVRASLSTAFAQLQEVLDDPQAPNHVRAAAGAVKQRLENYFAPDPELLQIVIAYRAKGQDRYGK